MRNAQLKKMNVEHLTHTLKVKTKKEEISMIFTKDIIYFLIKKTGRIGLIKRIIFFQCCYISMLVHFLFLLKVRDKIFMHRKK